MQFMQPQNQLTQPQITQPQNQYDFSGWGDRLTKIEEGIAGLTNQFNNFQTPGSIAPEYTGNTTPEPLEQPVNTGIESLPHTAETSMASTGRDLMGAFNQHQPRSISPLSQHLIDGEWRQLTPEEFGTKFPNSPFNQNGTMQQPLQLQQMMQMQNGMPIQQGLGSLAQFNKGPGI